MGKGKRVDELRKRVREKLAYVNFQSSEILSKVSEIKAKVEEVQDEAGKKANSLLGEKCKDRIKTSYASVMEALEEYSNLLFDIQQKINGSTGSSDSSSDEDEEKACEGKEKLEGKDHQKAGGEEDTTSEGGFTTPTQSPARLQGINEINRESLSSTGNVTVKDDSFNKLRVRGSEDRTDPHVRDIQQTTPPLPRDGQKPNVSDAEPPESRDFRSHADSELPVNYPVKLLAEAETNLSPKDNSCSNEPQKCSPGDSERHRQGEAATHVANRIYGEALKQYVGDDMVAFMTPNARQTIQSQSPVDGGQQGTACCDLASRIPPLELPCGQIHDISIQLVESPWLIWVQLVSVDLEDLIDEMTLHHSHLHSSDPDACLSGPPVIGAYVCALFALDKRWYRARITHIYRHKDDTDDNPLVSLVRIFYVDFGNSECQKFEDLRPLAPKYARLPAQAVPCALAEVAPLSASGVWGREEVVAFLRLLRAESASVAKSAIFDYVPGCSRWFVRIFPPLLPTRDRPTSVGAGFSPLVQEDISEGLLQQGIARRATNAQIAHLIAACPPLEDSVRHDTGYRVMARLNLDQIVASQSPTTKSCASEPTVDGQKETQPPSAAAVPLPQQTGGKSRASAPDRSVRFKQRSSRRKSAKVPNRAPSTTGSESPAEDHRGVVGAGKQVSQHSSRTEVNRERKKCNESDGFVTCSSKSLPCNVDSDSSFHSLIPSKPPQPTRTEVGPPVSHCEVVDTKISGTSHTGEVKGSDVHPLTQKKKGKTGASGGGDVGGTEVTYSERIKHNSRTTRQEMKEKSLPVQELVTLSPSQSLSDLTRRRIPPAQVDIPEDFIRLLISHIDSPGCLFVHLVDEQAIQQLEQLRKQLTEYYTHSNLANLKRFFPSECLDVHDVCVARFSEDDLFYRAEILQKSPAGGVGSHERQEDMVEVLYVDYGNREWISLEATYPIQPILTEFPAQAVCCRLAGILPRKVPPMDGEEEETGPPRFEEAWLKSATTCLREKAGFEKTLHGYVDLQNSAKTVRCGLDSKLPLLLVDCSGPEDVHINEELVRLGHATLEGALFRPPRKVPTPDDDGDDAMDNWKPMEDDYLSRRNNYDVDIEDAGVALTGYKSVGDDRICRFYAAGKRCWSGSDCPYKHVRPKDGEMTEAVSSVFMYHDERQVALPEEDTWVALEVTAIISPAHFYVHFPFGAGPIQDVMASGVNWQTEEFQSTFNELRDQMTNFYTEHPFECQDMVEQAVGEIVAVKDERDYKWYRCRVLQIAEDHGKLEVFYLDLGSKQWVSEKNVRQIKDAFLHTNFQVIECSLDILPAKEHWNSNIVEEFVKLVDGKILIAEVLLSSKMGPFTVELYDTSGEHDLCITELLVSKGSARLPATDQRRRHSCSSSSKPGLSKKGTVRHVPG